MQSLCVASVGLKRKNVFKFPFYVFSKNKIPIENEGREKNQGEEERI